MTDYETVEEGNSRKPVELYKIETVEGGTTWTYTSADFSVSYDGATYAPATLSRSEIAYNDSLNNTTVTIKIGYLEDPALDYLTKAPVDLIRVTIYKLFLNDGGTDARTLFVGTVKDASFQGNQAQITVVGYEDYLAQDIPRLRFSPRCNTYLFSDKCGLNKDDYAVSATITSVNGLTIICDSLGGAEDGYFARGYVSADGGKSMITGQEGTTLYLRYPLTMTVSGTIIAYPGCDGDVETCKAKFSNIENFRGFPNIPIENPCLWV